ncbi:glycosyltransferase [Conexibacter sp. W3-3-2]|uniref:UDP-N-acetylglucosamine--N-acetylmuramyl- (pentapeptide) pyrophosphoryl-undecaprenol N-acetylglucosamine transferase n=1 Tax=Conexibacter sp. W3-3-2 TaxID=2675227 RepID=UPI001323347C|nr:UDP-N-acetylglucosamine--N-acetylmuramyl-(pentapeptide) pyrophosphoryl-undecaprenol N-acetylglucosamine transferase [Conexibacter sp. W3-3-2]MTD43538.1 glycosyltransferase [Conexibacter sp. W3-3-2]
MTKVVIAAGGTAGHVVPALAVADALRAEGAQVAFVGGDRAEAELVPAAGYRLHRIHVEGISRSNPLKAARAVGRAAGALRAARRILREERPDVVMGGGGYVAGPVGAAALRAKLPLVLTEADSHLGLTNRLLAGRATRVCLAFPLPGREGDRYRVTGRPVPPPATDRAAARARFGLADGDTCLLVFGGSLGARSLNEATIGAYGTAAPAGLRVLHAAGRRDHDDLAARLGDPAPAHYDLRPYIDGFGEALLACDLCVARSGGSVFEVAAAGRPAVLVPYPHAAADHQTGNARWMVDGGAAVLVPDAELDADRLRREVDALLADRDRLAAMAAASAGLARPDAAAAIAAEVLAAARAS